MKVLAPGKLILSGEHAVVYGKPALAMAVNRYACAQIRTFEFPCVSFDFVDLSFDNNITFDDLDKLKHVIKEKYSRFKAGGFNIREVLQKPFELAQFALGLCLDMLHIKLSQGLRIHLSSTIPMGCGMGSSAATILSVIHAMANHAGVKVPLDKIYELGLQAENMQHGISSGIDLHVSLYGGCCYVKNQAILVKPLPLVPFYLINTGTPQSSTGECVTTVASHFKNSSLGDDFASVTDAMVFALENQSEKDFKSTVAANHDLLTTIGVVPQRVQQFIQDIHVLNGTAKTCGAGAVRGDAAGMVMVIMEDEDALQSLCHQYGYEILQVEGEMRGAHVSL